MGFVAFRLELERLVGFFPRSVPVGVLHILEHEIVPGDGVFIVQAGGAGSDQGACLAVLLIVGALRVALAPEKVGRVGVMADLSGPGKVFLGGGVFFFLASLVRPVPGFRLVPPTLVEGGGDVLRVNGLKEFGGVEVVLSGGKGEHAGNPLFRSQGQELRIDVKARLFIAPCMDEVVLPCVILRGGFKDGGVVDILLPGGVDFRLVLVEHPEVFCLAPGDHLLGVSGLAVEFGTDGDAFFQKFPFLFGEGDLAHLLAQGGLQFPFQLAAGVRGDVVVEAVLVLGGGGERVFLEVGLELLDAVKLVVFPILIFVLVLGDDLVLAGAACDVAGRGVVLAVQGGLEVVLVGLAGGLDFMFRRLAEGADAELLAGVLQEGFRPEAGVRADVAGTDVCELVGVVFYQGVQVAAVEAAVFIVQGFFRSRRQGGAAGEFYIEVRGCLMDQSFDALVFPEVLDLSLIHI